MFVGKDVATALGYAKPENAIATHVDTDDKTTTLIQGTGSNYCQWRKGEDAIWYCGRCL